MPGAPRATAWRARLLHALPEAVLFVIALGARLIPAIVHGGLTGNYGYDASVYYAAADGFVHGRMPYRDFVLLHPPGIMLVDSPFAALGSLTSDTVGFAAANLTFAVIAAVSAVLVTRVARMLGLPRRAALAGGVVYALWFGSFAAEYEARLEPLGCALLLCGLLAMLHSRAASAAGDGRRASWLAVGSGLALGGAISVKIWWLVPLVVVIGWQLVIDRSPRRAGWMAFGVLIAGVLVDLPFLLIARSAMWRMVVLDQLGRPVNTTPLRSFGYMSLGWLSRNASHTRLVVGVSIAAAVVVVLAWRAWRIPAARLVVVLFAAQVIQIAVDPSWFGFYADFVTVSLSLLAAAGLSPSSRTAAQPMVSKPSDRVGWLAPGLAVAMLLSLVWTLPRDLIAPFPGGRLSEAAERYRCVLSDAPMSLIDMNLLSRDFHNGCPNIVDVNGFLYDLLRGLPRSKYGQAKLTYNDYMRNYLRSGNAVVFLRSTHSINLSRATVDAIVHNGLIVDDQGHGLYRVTGPVSAAAR